MTSPEATNETTTVERTLNANIKLYYDIHVPPITPAPLLITLHGYGASKWHAMHEAKAMAPDGFALASLQGPHQHLKDPKTPGGPLRFGFGWLTNFHPEESIRVHHQALVDLIETMAGEGLADPQRIYLLGFSQSCALNYRFVFTQNELLRGVIGICGGLPGDWTTSEVYKKTSAAIFHLAGERDEFYTPARVADYAAQLRTRANEVEFRSYDAGHEITQPMRDDIREWLQNLEQ